MPEHPYGWYSLAPPLVAIVLAIATRRVVASLLAGVLIGALILTGGNPLSALQITIQDHLWPNLTSSDHLQVFEFTLMMGAMVGLMQCSGGMHGLVESLAPLARGRRGGQLMTWALGLIIFFDDYANSLLLGGTMRPLTDRMKISREKLAYLVDSTAAPVAGLAVVSTWVAGEIELIEKGFAAVGIADSVDAFAVFLETIPYRFYVLYALLFVPMIAILGRDFGPMLKAERRVSGSDPKTNETNRAGKSLAPAQIASTLEPDPNVPHRWINAVLPIVVMVSATVAVLLYTGAQTAKGEGLELNFFNCFSKGNSYNGLAVGSAIGTAIAALLPLTQRLLSPWRICTAAFHGAKAVAPALAILWMAWSLSGLTDKDHLAAGSFLGALAAGRVSIEWMPTIVFLLASVVAFSTGTSWGTMGILIPLSVSAVYPMLGEAADPHHRILIATIGSVLAGAIFGDHCSPISDTTVLSSHASGCDHVAHVWTQMPYALLVAAVSVVCGTLPIGYGVSAMLMLPLGLLSLVGFLFVVGRRVQTST